MKEEWRVIKDFPDYAVSNLGRVKRVNDNGNNRFAGSIIKARKNKRGYLYLTLYCGDKKKSLKVHRLVLEAFVGPCPTGAEGNHEDNNSVNNQSTNLTWKNHSENMLNSFRSGSKESLKGSKHGGAKLTEQNVLKIRELLSSGKLQKEIAEQFNVHVNTIGRIKNKLNWGHV